MTMMRGEDSDRPLKTNTRSVLGPPPQVVLDGNFIHMALRVKMDIKDRLKKLLLGSEPVLFVPR